MAFVGLVGLYACRVKRLEVRKRNPANFLALAVAYCVLPCVCRVGCCFGCFACVGCGLWWLCCWCWLFFPSDDCDKKKGSAVIGVPSLCSLVVFCFILLRWVLRNYCRRFLSSKSYRLPKQLKRNCNYNQLSYIRALLRSSSSGGNHNRLSFCLCLAYSRLDRGFPYCYDYTHRCKPVPSWCCC